jgi:hypothetical protein
VLDVAVADVATHVSFRFADSVCAPQDAFSGTGMMPSATLPPKLMAAATRQWMFSNRRSPGWRPSRLQASVAGVLGQGLGLTVQQEALTDDGLFSIDVAVEWKGRCALSLLRVDFSWLYVSSCCRCDDGMFGLMWQWSGRPGACCAVD